MKSHLGKIHIYTGPGQGKTQAALGLALRALGRGYKVCVIQFMKGKLSGENLIAKKLAPDYKIYQFGKPGFIKKGEGTMQDKKLAKQGLDFAKKILQEKKIDLLILDEVNVALDFGLLKLQDVIEFLKRDRTGVEIILTGRAAHRKVCELADLVTYMKNAKHYFKKGIGAREGIEF
ncbi:MAG: cob(I)yrinic acid a,c-diamide adenosyltransferase [Patescibacteria group bacterium]